METIATGLAFGFFAVWGVAIGVVTIVAAWDWLRARAWL
jgi:hypothetical protein